MKTIRFIQQLDVIETYDLDYTEADFLMDCELYNIENFTFDELCDVLENEKEVMITVTELHYNTDLEEWVNGPHMVEAGEFFAMIMDDLAYDAGPTDSETVDINNRMINVEDRPDPEDSYPC